MKRQGCILGRSGERIFFVFCTSLSLSLSPWGSKKEKKPKKKKKRWEALLNFEWDHWKAPKAERFPKIKKINHYLFMIIEKRSKKEYIYYRYTCFSSRESINYYYYFFSKVLEVFGYGCRWTCSWGLYWENFFLFWKTCRYLYLAEQKKMPFSPFLFNDFLCFYTLNLLCLLFLLSFFFCVI